MDGSIAKIVELQRNAETGIAQHLYDLLQIVPLFTADPELLALDRSLNLEAGILDHFDHLARQLLVQSFPDDDRLARAFVHFDDVAEVQAIDVDAAPRHLFLQNRDHLLDLKFRLGFQRELVTGLFDTRVRTLEIVTRTDFTIGLIERVAQLVLIDLGNHIE